mgnify:CR=1 FL=1
MDWLGKLTRLVKAESREQQGTEAVVQRLELVKVNLSVSVAVATQARR